MRTRETVELTNMCIISNEEMVLVEEKNLGDSTGIIFPGGHVEPQEPITESVIREIYEETGLTISNPKLCGIKDWIREDGTRYIVFLYKASEYSGELVSSDEGKVFWIKKSELEKYNIIWNMKEVYQIVNSDTCSEFFFSQVSPDNKCGQVM